MPRHLVAVRILLERGDGRLHPAISVEHRLAGAVLIADVRPQVVDPLRADPIIHAGVEQEYLVT